MIVRHGKTSTRRMRQVGHGGGGRGGAGAAATQEPPAAGAPAISSYGVRRSGRDPLQRRSSSASTTVLAAKSMADSKNDGRLTMEETIIGGGGTQARKTPLKTAGRMMGVPTLLLTTNVAGREDLCVRLADIAVASSRARSQQGALRRGTPGVKGVISSRSLTSRDWAVGAHGVTAPAMTKLSGLINQARGVAPVHRRGRRLLSYRRRVKRADQARASAPQTEGARSAHFAEGHVALHHVAPAATRELWYVERTPQARRIPASEHDLTKDNKFADRRLTPTPPNTGARHRCDDVAVTASLDQHFDKANLATRSSSKSLPRATTATTALRCRQGPRRRQRDREDRQVLHLRLNVR